MRSVTQFFSKPRGRAVHGVDPVADVRIRRRSVATAAATVLAIAGIALAPAVIARDRRDDGHWVGTWSASPQAVAKPVQINGQTVRQIVHTSVGGERVRVRLSNAFGTSGLLIGSAHVAVSSGGATISPGTDRVLTFNGSPIITIIGGTFSVANAINARYQIVGTSNTISGLMRGFIWQSGRMMNLGVLGGLDIEFS